MKKYIIIENLMGGVAWIIHESTEEDEAIEKFNKLFSNSSHDNLQLLTVDEEDLKEYIEKGTLQYL